MGGSCSLSQAWMRAETARVSPAVLGHPCSPGVTSREGSTAGGKQLGCLTHCPHISPLPCLSTPFPGDEEEFQQKGTSCRRGCDGSSGPVAVGCSRQEGEHARPCRAPSPAPTQSSDRSCLTRPRCGTGQFVWTLLGSLPGSRRSSCCQQPAMQPRGDPTSAPRGPTPGAAVLTPPSWLGEEFRMGFPPPSHPSPEGPCWQRWDAATPSSHPWSSLPPCPEQRGQSGPGGVWDHLKGFRIPPNHCLAS